MVSKSNLAVRIVGILLSTFLVDNRIEKEETENYRPFYISLLPTYPWETAGKIKIIQPDSTQNLEQFALREETREEKIERDRSTTNNPHTFKEISDACLKNPEGTAETGGVMYKIPDNTTKPGYRLSFYMVDNITNKDSEAKKVIEQGKSLDLTKLREGLNKYTEGKCAIYNADTDWKEEIDKLKRKIAKFGKKDKLSRREQLTLARETLAITNSTYLRGDIPESNYEMVGVFHVHNNGTNFSLTDHCLYDNAIDKTGYLISCVDNERFRVHRIIGTEDIVITEGEITK